MSPGDPRTAIVTCMDARLDAAGFLASWPPPAHIFRNAGGRVTADALRSLAVSCATGTERILVVHHTQCAMAEHSEADLRAKLPRGAQPETGFLTIADPDEALKQDVHSIRDSALIPPGVEVRGFVYDLETHAIREMTTR